ncbi:hypothetical protein L484_016213 [Morus notabilis]|uniref:Uncharacterized protein n=1 Tax=Morus notabilis TaxID=981085 RepID=W9SCU5_9ROSA|nr:hypothetical protein L484_016213 [Morus notabilis]
MMRRSIFLHQHTYQGYPDDENIQAQTFSKPPNNENHDTGGLSRRESIWILNGENHHSIQIADRTIAYDHGETVVASLKALWISVCKHCGAPFASNNVLRKRDDRA